MEDYFSEDGLDDLNDTALQELENNAIQSTQAAHPRPGQSQLPDPRSADFETYALEDDDLDDAVVIDELAQLPARHPSVEKSLAPRQARTAPPAVAGQAAQRAWNPYQQGVPPGVAGARFSNQSPTYPSPPPGGPARAPPLASQRYPPARPMPPPSRHAHPSQSQFVRPPVPQPLLAHRYAAQPSQVLQAAAAGPGAHGHDQGDIVAALQARVAALESELVSAKGEVSIVRGKYDKAHATHDAELARLKKQNAEQAAKQERAVEAALAAERVAATELQFTRQDLKEELDKSRKGRGEGAGAGGSGLGAGPGTPSKKNKTWGVSDGFDDVEILPSPSKGQGRRGKDTGAIAIPVGERTPTKGKRKRPAVDSPVTALETEDVVMFDDPPAHANQTRGGTQPRPDALSFEFLKLVLDHSGFHGRPLTFDLFSRYSFPSDPAQSFASLIFQKLPSLGSPHDPKRLLVDFSELILDIWSQCLREKYHEPIYDLVSLVSFVLQLDTTSIAPQVITSLVPIVQTTIYLVAVPRFNSADGDLTNHPDATVQELYLEVDISGAFSLMYLAALACGSALPPRPDSDFPSPSQDPARAQFWRLVQLEFVLMMLSPKQPPDDFLGMLALLCTSSLPESIGPVTGDEDKDPTFVARFLIDRVSFYLTDPPRWAVPEHRRYSTQLAALQVLVAFATSAFGIVKLAENGVAIPRLVSALCAAIDSLYDMDPPGMLVPEAAPAAGDPGKMDLDLVRGDQGQAQHDPNQTQEASITAQKPMPDEQAEGIAPEGPPGEPSAEDDEDGEECLDSAQLLHQLISQATLLLHTLVTDPRTANRANVPAKLAASHGGAQRYLLTLARLNFAEDDLVLEAGIDADTVERAHELLELAVTPDEGESIGEVFGF